MSTTIKTAKIKSVDEVSSPYGPHAILYHSLEMDNGDKINIGKKTLQKVGWEVTYEITGDPTQQKYAKAQSAKKEDAPQDANTPSSNQPQQPQREPFKQDPDKARSIEMQVCLKEANQYHAINGFETTDPYSRKKELCDTTKVIFDELFGLGKDV